MNSDEKQAYEFLNANKFKVVDFEPNGKSTVPDFLLQNNIAVEIRRLNKNIEINGNYEGIEMKHFTVIEIINFVINSIKEYSYEYSINLIIQFQRVNYPKKTKHLRKEIKNAITSAIEQGSFDKVLNILNCVYIELKKVEKEDQFIRIFSIYDRDMGGTVQNVRYESLKIAIEEKEKKVNSINNIYSKIWLILVDHIFSRVDYTTKQDLHGFPEIESSFDRVILLHSRDINEWIDIYPW